MGREDDDVRPGFAQRGDGGRDRLGAAELRVERAVNTDGGTVAALVEIALAVPGVSDADGVQRRARVGFALL